jgi:hypothetical protein
LYVLYDNGIYRLNLNNANELDFKPENHSLIILTNHVYLIDYDPVENYLYFAECTVPIRPIIMSCSKTSGIYRINLNQSIPRKEV